MKKLLTILLILFSGIAIGQTTGYVLKKSDGTVDLPNNAITQLMVIGLPDSLANHNERINTKAPLVNGGIGYSAGASGNQAGNKSNAVTVNALSGRVTMTNSALAAAAEVSFTLNNSTIAATDVVIANIQSVGTVGSYLISVTAVSAGSCSITISNVSAGSLSQSLVINFIVLKGAVN